MAVDGDFIGRGWRYPLRGDARGPRYEGGADRIRQSIWLILSHR